MTEATGDMPLPEESERTWNDENTVTTNGTQTSVNESISTNKHEEIRMQAAAMLQQADQVIHKTRSRSESPTPPAERPDGTSNTKTPDTPGKEDEPTFSPGESSMNSFVTEIERMSKDTDAMLASIRKEVVESPEKKRDNRNEHHDGGQTSAPGNNVSTADKKAAAKIAVDDDDWDDDMSDEIAHLGESTEELRQALDAEAKQAESNFLRNRKKKEATEATECKEAPPTPKPEREHVDGPLLLGVILVWVVVVIHLLRALFSGILDAEGRLVLPFSSG